MSRRRSRGRRVKTGAIRQLEFQQVHNPYKPMDVLSVEQVGTIHSRSLDLLESFGINFLLPEARELLGKAGAILDPDRPRVRFDLAVEEALDDYVERRIREGGAEYGE